MYFGKKKKNNGEKKRIFNKIGVAEQKQKANDLLIAS